MPMGEAPGETHFYVCGPVRKTLDEAITDANVLAAALHSDLRYGRPGGIWLSMEEGVPGAHRHVLIYDPAGGAGSTYRVAWLGTDGEWITDAPYTPHPTHWMPLPVGPR
jgi:Protein of unknown function (DUF551)